jgi:hypothetical protein
VKDLTSENKLFSPEQFSQHNVSNRIIVMGLEEPNLFFKTVSVGLEKLGQQETSNYRKIELELEEKPIGNKRGSISGWLNMSEIKRKESSGQ